MKYTYRFSITSPANVDAKVIMLVRYVMDDDTNVLGQEVVTRTGWQRFEQWDTIDIDRLPVVTGRDMLNELACQARLDEWETHIRTMVRAI